jgi:hypothetical protein
MPDGETLLVSDMKGFGHPGPMSNTEMRARRFANRHGHDRQS